MGQVVWLRTLSAGVLTALVIAGAVAAGADTSSPFTLNGRVQYETFGYPDADTRSDQWENFFAASLTGKGHLGSQVDFEIEARAVADDAEYTAGVYDLRNANVRRPYLGLTTAVIDYRPIPELRLSIGKQIVDWDVFDGIQPANLLSSLDQSDPFRTEKQGVDAITMHYQPGAAYLDLTVVPLAFTPSRSPQDRWIIVPSVVGYHADLPPVQLDETQAGVRFGAHLGDLDASAFGYVGRDHLPIFALNFERLSVESKSPRLRAGGVNASYPLGERLLLRFEAVYLTSPDANRSDFVDSLVGGEYTLGDWRLVLGYLRQDLTSRAPEKVLSQGERVFFQSFVSGEVRWDDGGPWQAHLRGGYDTRGEFALVEPEVSYRVWQPMRVVLSGLLITSGRDNTYFHRIRHEDRLGLRVEYAF